MNALYSTPASTSVARRGFIALALMALGGLLLVLPGGARADRSSANTTASQPNVKSRFDRLLVKGVHSGVLVRGSVLPGSQHANARVSLLLRHGTQGAFKQVQTVKLNTNDRNFAFLDHIAPGQWGVEVRFKDPGKVLATTSHAKTVTVLPVFGHPISPGSVKINNGSVTYTATVPAPKSATTVQLLGLDVGPLAGTTQGTVHTPAGSFKVLATTPVAAGTSAITFTLNAKLKQGQRWTLLLQRNFGHMTGIDYAGLKTVRVS